MRLDLGLILGITLEILYFIFYANTLFYRKISNTYKCYAIISGCYLLHLIICMFGILSVNILVFILANIVSFTVCYYVNFKNAFFHSILLLILSISSEWAIIFLPSIGIIPQDTVLMNSTQSLILTLISKSLYLIGIILVSKLLYKDKRSFGTPSLILALIPFLTVVILLFMLNINITSWLLSIICIILILINMILLLINKRMVSKDLEIAELREEALKEKVLLDEYQLLKEKHEKMVILQHDFKEHMNALNVLISKNDTKAKEYMKTICDVEMSTHFIEYSDHNMLNVLLMKKKDECTQLNIEFSIDPIQAHMDFLEDMDVVTLFSNLFNNAIESCTLSTQKKIYLTIHTTNENFIVIKLANTADAKPIVFEGKLRTHKANKELHGIGMNSIKRSIEKYSGSLNWAYDQTEKLFYTTIILHNNTTRD